MPKVTVYTPTGEKVDMEPVDARECVLHCGYSYIPPENPADHNRQIYRSFPNTMLDAGELGLIQFDEHGEALVTPEQAKWLDDGVAVGLLGDPHDVAVFKPQPEFDGQAERVSEPVSENTSLALTEEANTAVVEAQAEKPAKAKK
jgi:hypothetical protein